MRRTSIDLFCGCGGFSLGMERAGFTTVAALDANPQAVKVFKANFTGVAHVLEKDLTKFEPAELAELIGISTVDVIVGGPPCQGFSNARKVDGSNNGPKIVADSRRYLYQEFIKYVGYFKPRAFVMENVLGIKTAGGGEYFLRVQEEARALGYRVHGQVVKAVEFGVPQKRIRQLIIGTRLDVPECFRDSFMPATHSDQAVTLGEAIDDLPILRAGGGEQKREYDFQRRVNHLLKYGTKFLDEVIQIDKSTELTAHVARPHSERDLRDFDRIREGENSQTALKRGVKFEFPYNKDVFCDRYTRQHRKRPCSTIVAHLSKDGLMFIHPSQNRSLTPREAARVQTFPDWFSFPVERTHQFRVIGNAVPPIIGEAVGRALNRYFKAAEKTAPTVQRSMTTAEAVKEVSLLLRAANEAKIVRFEREDFMRAWTGIGRLFPALHPAGALENGTAMASTEDWKDSLPEMPGSYYRQSGWPVSLVPVAKEAWRRHRRGELVEEEIFKAFV